MRRLPRLVATLGVALSTLAVPALTAAPVSADPSTPAQVGETPGRRAAPSDDALPTLKIHRPVTKRQHVWDVKFVEGKPLYDERKGKLWILQGGKQRTIEFPRDEVWTGLTAGLAGLEVDPDFSTNQRIYTCQAVPKGDGAEQEVRAWTLDLKTRKATLVDSLLRGIPVTDGEHAGCRLLIDRAGSLWVSTGDASVGTYPQSRRTFAGKTLRLDRLTGAPWPNNPWADAKFRIKRYVVTYGHRNPQGLAQRSNGQIWEAEQGTARDDEVNLLKPRGNYGWDPAPGYMQGSPMTDFSLPGPQLGARWKSGYPTLACSGIGWVRGQQWGVLNGTLAVGCLKARKVIFMKFDQDGKLLWTKAPQELQEFGRMRSVTEAPNGDLLFTTDNGVDDGIVRVKAVG